MANDVEPGQGVPRAATTLALDAMSAFRVVLVNGAPSRQDHDPAPASSSPGRQPAQPRRRGAARCGRARRTGLALRGPGFQRSGGPARAVTLRALPGGLLRTDLCRRLPRAAGDARSASPRMVQQLCHDADPTRHSRAGARPAGKRAASAAAAAGRDDGAGAGQGPAGRAVPDGCAGRRELPAVAGDRVPHPSAAGLVPQPDRQGEAASEGAPGRHRPGRPPARPVASSARRAGVAHARAAAGDVRHQRACQGNGRPASST